MKPTLNSLKVLTIFALFLLCLFAPIYIQSYRAFHKQDETLVQESKIDSLEQLKSVIESLPDGAFKANLYIILATEYAGDSIDLHSILSAYAKMQMQKLQGKKNGNTI